jgi:hypothetical protein
MFREQKIPAMIKLASSLLSYNTRRFSTASKVLPAVEKLNNKFTQKALDLYKQNKIDVDKELDKV